MVTPKIHNTSAVHNPFPGISGFGFCRKIEHTETQQGTEKMGMYRFTPNSVVVHTISTAHTDKISVTNRINVSNDRNCQLV